MLVSNTKARDDSGNRPSLINGPAPAIACVILKSTSLLANSECSSFSSFGYVAPSRHKHGWSSLRYCHSWGDHLSHNAWLKAPDHCSAPPLISYSAPLTKRVP